MIKYLRITDEKDLLDLSYLSPFKAVVISEIFTSVDCKKIVSKWLIRSGCLYVMAWGRECGSWHDFVDWARSEDSNYDEIPEASFVMTTWHDDEPLAEVIWYAKYAALHLEVELQHTLFLHIAPNDKSGKFKRMYRKAR